MNPNHVKNLEYLLVFLEFCKTEPGMEKFPGLYLKYSNIISELQIEKDSLVKIQKGELK